MSDKKDISFLIEHNGQIIPFSERVRGRPQSKNIEDRRGEPYGATRFREAWERGDATFQPLALPTWGGFSDQQIPYIGDDYYIEDPTFEVADDMSAYATGGEVRESDVADHQPDQRPHAGLLDSTVPGRTDRLPITVVADSYVVPADVVSGLGQGNTTSGAAILDDLLALKAQAFAAGGRTPAPAGGSVRIIAAGGEYIITPDKVAAVGGGDPEAGHRLLDKMVKRVRRTVAQRMLKLPGPRRD